MGGVNYTAKLLQAMRDPESDRFIEISPRHVVRLFFDTELDLIIVNQGTRVQILSFEELEKIALSDAFIQAMGNIGKSSKKHLMMTSTFTGISILTYHDSHKISIARTTYAEEGVDGIMPEPVVLTQDAITVPESEGLTFLDSILMLATNQYFPILTTDNAVIQASLDILQLATLLRTWRHTKYDAESKTTKAVKGLLNLVVYDNQTSWQALRTLFTCVSTFKSQDFENLHRIIGPAMRPRFYLAMVAMVKSTIALELHFVGYGRMRLGLQERARINALTPHPLRSMARVHRATQYVIDGLPNYHTAREFATEIKSSVRDVYLA